MDVDDYGDGEMSVAEVKRGFGGFYGWDRSLRTVEASRVLFRRL